jgi:pilus assembly protein Flp/PilA
MEGNMFLRICAMKEAFARCDKGATAIEYGLIAAGIAVAIATVVFAVGSDLKTLFTGIGTAITSVPPAA